ARTALVKLIDRITTEVFTLWWENSTEKTRSFYHLARAFPGLVQVNGKIANTPLLDWLYQRLRSRDARVRNGAAEVFQYLSPVLVKHPSVTSTLLDLLQDTDKDVCSSAAEALGRLGPAAAEHPQVIPALLAALQNRNLSVRHSV